MTKTEIQDAANIKRVQTLRAQGHTFEFTIGRNRKGNFAVGMVAWASGDAQRHMPYLSYCASFVSNAHARAYIKMLEG